MAAHQADSQRWPQRGPGLLRARVAFGVALKKPVIEDEIDYILVFPLALLDKVAAIVKPRTKRHLNAEQRKACTDRLKRHQFAARQSAETGQESLFDTKVRVGKP